MGEYSEAREPDLDGDAIVEILEEAPVKRGILFGSYARGEDRAASDVDIAVEFEESLSSTERTRARLGLIERASVALGLDEVDVIPMAGASSDLRREIREDGIVLYGPTETAPSTDDLAESDHDETVARFDEILAELERVV